MHSRAGHYHWLSLRMRSVRPSVYVLGCTCLLKAETRSPYSSLFIVIVILLSIVVGVVADRRKVVGHALVGRATHRP